MDYQFMLDNASTLQWPITFLYSVNLKSFKSVDVCTWRVVCSRDHVLYAKPVRSVNYLLSYVKLN